MWRWLAALSQIVPGANAGQLACTPEHLTSALALAALVGKFLSEGIDLRPKVIKRFILLANNRQQGTKCVSVFFLSCIHFG